MPCTLPNWAIGCLLRGIDYAGSWWKAAHFTQQWTKTPKMACAHSMHAQTYLQGDAWQGAMRLAVVLSEEWGFFASDAP